MTWMIRLASVVALGAVGIGLNARQGQPGRAGLPAVADVVTFEDLQLPAPLVAAKIHATVVVAAALDDQGRVVATSPVSGHEPMLGLSLDNLKKWTFVPNAERRAVVVYYFKVEGSCRDNSRSLFQLVLKNFVTITGCVRPL